MVRTSHVVDYWNPQQRQWLVRITDNPANNFIDHKLMQGPSIGWTLRSLRARPGEAIPVGPIAVGSPQGEWTATPAGTAWANMTAGRQGSPAVDAQTAQALGRIAANMQYPSGVWVAPACNYSSNGCR